MGTEHPARKPQTAGSPHAPEQRQPSPRQTRARVSLVVRVAAGAQLSGQQTTRDRAPAPQTGCLPWVPGSGPRAGSRSAS